MELTLFPMFVEKPDGIIAQVLVRDRDEDFMASFGWVKDPKELFKPVPDPELPEVDGDKGCGRPGSIEWHLAKIKEFKTKKAVIRYVAEITNIKITFTAIDKLTKVKFEAYKIIREALNDRES